MASRRKQFARSKPAHRGQPAAEQFEFACFMADLLDGTITATALHEVRNGQGRLVRIDYDDPNG